MYARDVEINDSCYRRLDPEYFAWLRHRMGAVQKSFTAGKVPGAVYGPLRQRFNEIQVRAIDLFGEPALLAAIAAIDPEMYRPPLAEVEPPARQEPAPRVRAERDRLACARELVNAIRDEALALGWTMDGLYRSANYERRPFGGGYGLVCYIERGWRLGQVTRQSIELIGPPPAEPRMRFYNPDLEQPWVRRVQVTNTPQNAQ
jgi:hypothetical protein